MRPGVSGETRLGLIVPSSNTNAEPLTAAMLTEQAVISVASRFPLPADLDTKIEEALLGPAADLIADAGVAAIAFHGTSGCWLGLDRDRALADALQRRTGAAATTASLATVAGLRALGARRVGLVFPGPAHVAAAIADEFARHGIEICNSSLPTEPLSNQQISGLSFAEIDSLIVPARSDRVDALVCVGTNLRAAYLVAELEDRLGLPIVDSAAAVVWQLLTLAGVSVRLPGWGRLLEHPTTESG